MTEELTVVSVETSHTPHVSEARRGAAGVYLDNVHVGDTHVAHWDGVVGIWQLRAERKFLEVRASVWPVAASVARR